MLFCFFLAVQQVNDRSQLIGLIMRAQFTSSTIVATMILAPLIVNAGTVLTVWLIAKPFTQQEANLFGCIVIYYILAYEIMFHILSFTASYI